MGRWLVGVLLAVPGVSLATVEHIEVQGRAPAPNATIIQAADVYRQGMTLQQMLRQVPGLYVRQSGGPGGDISVSLEGSGSGQLLVLLNGEPMTSTTLGTPLLQHIDAAEIASIEVVHGGGAAAYGAGAMAGVLHLRTHAGGDSVLSVSGMRGGSSDSGSRMQGGSGYARVSQVLDERTVGALSVGLRDERTLVEARQPTTAAEQDFLPRYQNQHANIAFERERRGNRTLRVSHRYQASEADFAQSCADATSFDPVACQPWLETRQNLTQIEQSREFRSRTGRLSLSYLHDAATTYDHLDDDAAWSGFGERYQTERLRAGYVNERRLEGGGTVTRGAQWYREYAKSNALTYDQQSRTNFALFNQYTSEEGSGFGVRAERLSTGTWVVGADLQTVLQRSDAGSSVLKVSNGYREPGFNDLYWPGAGNPDLRRERSQSAHLDMRYELGAVSVSARPFYQRWRNLIQWAPVDGTMWAPQNVASARSYGTTLSAAQQLTEQLGWYATVTVQGPKDSDSGVRLAYRPSRMGQLELNYQLGDWQWRLAAHGRSGIADANGAAIAGYLTYGLNASWQANDVLEVSVVAENLTDHRYAEGANWFEPGRQIRLGLTWRY